MLLKHLTELAINAHNWTSFSPERRGENLIKEFSQELENDLHSIIAEGAKYEIQMDIVAATVLSYKEKYERHFTSWLHAKSNCMSSMITGPARFPVRKAEKANNAEHAKLRFLMEWRERCLKAIVRGFKPKETVLTELEKHRIELAKRLKSQEIMKQTNAIIRKAKGSDCTDALIELGLSKSAALNLQSSEGKWWGTGFARFELTNNNANIKRIEARIASLEVKATKIEAGAAPEVTINGVRILQNFADDRVQLFFDGKPPAEIITLLKSRAFKWSPRNMAWQRKLTTEASKKAVEIAQQLI